MDFDINNTKNNVEKKQRLGFQSDIILKKGQIWIHEFFPIINQVEITDSMTLDDFVSQLNAAIDNKSYEWVDKLIESLEELKKKNEIAKKKLTNFYRDFEIEINFYNLILSYEPINIEILLNKKLLFLDILYEEINNLKKIYDYKDYEITISKLNSLGWSIKN